MSFLLHSNHTFLLVNQNNKYGLFCQLFTASGITRPLSLQPSATNYYHATLDATGNPHIVNLPTSSRLTYFCYENNHFTKKNILELSPDDMTLSWPLIHYMDGQIHLFYLTYKVATRTYAFVHSLLGSLATETLFESTIVPQAFKSTIVAGKIYIFYTLFQEAYCMRCIEFTPSTLEQYTLLTTSMPLIDYSFCIHEDTIHLCYVTQNVSQYTLFYAQPLKNQITSIGTYTSLPLPTLFWYYHHLWLNTLVDHKLFVQLSIDGGQSFSLAVPSSLQGATTRHTFISSEVHTLAIHEVYASTQNAIRISILAALDVEHIHFDIELPVELELLLEGLRLSNASHAHASTLAAENIELKAKLASLEAKYAALPTSPSLTLPQRKPLSIQAAANAFMEESPQWDVPPLI
ncbi:hypothetical protein CS063_07940 [Sporanaerobium hydrogeniformans]|uniref:Uncharacterized protein n=1 Tax=Sporanaerobium hydrogeniformans TaxID=3072179 RepID=A0AC61DE78_9FIRM|nr:hypothetical protein [Sporanaerobium hydrogeniformans]PHV70942.1 hypothetical protein CS063_07940 [Sporanaerobium hydrogeniformans]